MAGRAPIVNSRPTATWRHHARDGVCIRSPRAGQGGRALCNGDGPVSVRDMVLREDPTRNDAGDPDPLSGDAWHHVRLTPAVRRLEAAVRSGSYTHLRA